MKKWPLSITAGIVIATILQTAALGWIIVERSLLLRNGKEVRLAVRPVDPRDLFRGDYVVLRYDISWIGPNITGPDHGFKKQDIIYVGMKGGSDGLWKAVSAHKTLPPPEDNTVFIQGRVKYPRSSWPVPIRNQSSQQEQSPPCPDKKSCYGITVKYGLESYFVPEGEGRELERIRNKGKIDILAAIDNSGRSAIKALIVDGKKAYVEPLL